MALAPDPETEDEAQQRQAEYKERKREYKAEQERKAEERRQEQRQQQQRIAELAQALAAMLERVIAKAPENTHRDQLLGGVTRHPAPAWCGCPRFADAEWRQHGRRRGAVRHCELCTVALFATAVNMRRV